MESKKMLLAATAMVAVSMVTGPSFAQSVDMAVADQATTPAKPAKKAAKDKMVAAAAAKPAPAAPAVVPVAAERAEIEALRKQVRELAEQLNDVRLLTSSKLNKLDQDTQEALSERAKGKGTQFTYANGRPVFSTTDGNFSIAFRLRSQLDVGKYFQDANLSAIPTTPTTVGLSGASSRLAAGPYFRRMYFGFEGKFMKDWEYEIRLDGGSSGAEKAVSLDNIRLGYAGIEHFVFELGAWDIGQNIDQATSSGDFFLIERSSPQTVATGMAAGGQRKAIGFRYFRDLNKNAEAKTADSFYAHAYLTADSISNPSAANAFTNVTNPTTGVVTAVLNPAGDATQSAGVNQSVNLIARAGYRTQVDTDTALYLDGNYTKIISPKAFQSNTLPGSAVKGGLISFSDRPEFRGDPTSLISTGNIPAKSAEEFGVSAAGQYKNFLLEGNYYHYEIERDLFVLPVSTVAGSSSNPDFEGYDVAASWILTGEARGFNKELFGWSGVAPKSPFSMKGGTGAFEAVARYSVLDLNYNAGNAGTAAIGGTPRNVGGNGATTVVSPTPTDGRIRGGRQEISTLGMNWYANRNVRFLVQYSMAKVDRLNNAGQQIGQDLNILATRVQFAF